MSSRFVAFLLIIGGGILLGACDFPTSEPCTQEELEAPVLTSPAPYSFIDGGFPLTPHIVQWTYPGDCEPAGFEVSLSLKPDFANVRVGETSGDESGWPDPDDEYPQVALETAEEYFWRVRATSGSGFANKGPWSSVRVFFTEPSCTSAADMTAPELLSPADGAEVGEYIAQLHYHVADGGCVPQGYFIDLQTVSDFSGGSLLTTYDMPGTFVFTEELDDCITYYWRVAPVYDGYQGPFSETRSFRINVSCMDPALPMTAMPSLYLPCTSASELIAPELVAPASRSFVGDDPLDSSYPGLLEWNYTGSCRPEGYRVELSKDHNFDNSTSAETEDTSWPPDLPVQSLDPGMEYWWRVTGMVNNDIGPFSSPRAFFTGPLCTSATELNAPLLIYPENNAALDMLFAELHYIPDDPACIPEGYYIDLQTEPSFSGTTDYGEYNLPATTLITDDLDDCTVYYWRVAQIFGGIQGPFSETRSFFINELGTCPLPAPRAMALLNLNCRFGPGTAYDIVSNLMEGESAAVVAQNAIGTWFVVENPTGRGTCWLSKPFVQTFGILDNLPVQVAPPLPTATPVPPVALVCNKDLGREVCKAAGGMWPDIDKPYCICP